MPPDNARDPKVIAEAVSRLKTFRGTFKGMDQKDLASLKHEGHRF